MNWKTERKRYKEIEWKKKQARLRWMALTAALVALVFIVLAVIYAPNPQPLEFAYDELPVLGSKNAPVKIVEFGDFKCPACRYFSEQIKPRLVEDYIQNGTIALYFINHTIVGPDSFAAAMAGQSIFRQKSDEFWKFYDAIYKNQGNPTELWATPEFLVDLARAEQLNVDYDKLKQDIENETYAEDVIAQNEMAEKWIKSTPTLFINGMKFEDFSNYKALKKEIEKEKKKAR